MSQSGENSDANEALKLRVGDNLKERRIDKYLHGRFSQYSRSMIQEMIKLGGVTVNGKKVKASFRLCGGETVELTLPELPSREIEPEDIPLDIIYEDDDLIILNKPANMIVHPARGNLSGTLVNALAHYSNELSSGLGEFRPGIVHRLDRNTTGVMIVTKNDIAQWKVAKQFELRQTKKTYLAIAHGSPQLDADRINAPLGTHPTVREKYAVRYQGGKDSITYYEVLERFRGYSILKMSPKTGRTHQIRVHLAHIKHPIVADDMYGGKLVYPWQLEDRDPVVEEPVLSRVALHAFSIEFKHPTTEKQVIYEAPLPDDMQHLIDQLRKFRSL